MSWRDMLDMAARAKEDWNGCGAAPAPTAESVARCGAFLDSVEVLGEPASVLPSVKGGIGVTYLCGVREVYVEFANSGGALVVLSSFGQEEDPLIVPLGETGPQAIAAHLGGAE